MIGVDNIINIPAVKNSSDLPIQIIEKELKNDSKIKIFRDMFSDWDTIPDFYKPSLKELQNMIPEVDLKKL